MCVVHVIGGQLAVVLVDDRLWSDQTVTVIPSDDDVDGDLVLSATANWSVGHSDVVVIELDFAVEIDSPLISWLVAVVTVSFRVASVVTVLLSSWPL